MQIRSLQTQSLIDEIMKLQAPYFKKTAEFHYNYKRYLQPVTMVTTLDVMLEIAIITLIYRLVMPQLHHLSCLSTDCTGKDRRATFCMSHTGCVVLSLHAWLPAPTTTAPRFSTATGCVPRVVWHLHCGGKEVATPCPVKEWETHSAWEISSASVSGASSYQTCPVSWDSILRGCHSYTHLSLSLSISLPWLHPPLQLHTTPSPPTHTHTHSSCVFPFLVCSWEHSAFLSHFCACLLPQILHMNFIRMFFLIISPTSPPTALEKKKKKKAARKRNHNIND